VKEILKDTGGGVKRIWPERCDGMVPLALFGDTNAGTLLVVPLSPNLSDTTSEPN